MQVPVPEQPQPDQPVKIEPVLAVAVSVTDVPGEYEAVHVVPQLMPVGELVTVPVPLPDLVTDNVQGVVGSYSQKSFFPDKS